MIKFIYERGGADNTNPEQGRVSHLKDNELTQAPQLTNV
jgi:hypothetical protein